MTKHVGFRPPIDPRFHEFASSLEELQRGGVAPGHDPLSAVADCATFRGQGLWRNRITEARLQPHLTFAARRVDAYLGHQYESYRAFGACDADAHHRPFTLPERALWLPILTRNRMDFVATDAVPASDRAWAAEVQDTDFAIIWRTPGGLYSDERPREEFSSTVSEKLGSGVLIDLGGGFSMVRVCEQAAAAGHPVPWLIDVDLGHPIRTPVEHGARWDVAHLPNVVTPTSGIHADILAFLKALPDRCRWLGYPINFSLNGIDLAVKTDPAYHRAIAEEIDRVATKDSSIFVSDSEALRTFFGLGYEPVIEPMDRIPLSLSPPYAGIWRPGDRRTSTTKHRPGMFSGNES